MKRATSNLALDEQHAQWPVPCVEMAQPQVMQYSSQQSGIADEYFHVSHDIADVKVVDAVILTLFLWQAQLGIASDPHNGCASWQTKVSSLAI